MEDLVNQLQEENEDPFKRLPDDLIVCCIFDKISEAKSLCFISLVSKNFSSLVYQSNVVSLKVHFENNEPNSLSLPGKFLRVVTAPLRLVHGLFSSLLQRFREPSYSKETEFIFLTSPKFLGRFTSLTSLYVELDFSDLNFKKEPVVKWYLTKPSAFIFLVAKSIDLATHDDENVDLTADDIVSLAVHFQGHLQKAQSRFSVMENWFPILPESLQNVVVTDSMKQGKLELGEDVLVDMRTGNTNFRHLDGGRIRFWADPLVKLPLSGCVMKMGMLLICKDKEADFDDFLIAKEAFNGEEERVFAEAAMELLKKDLVLEEILPAQA